MAAFCESPLLGSYGAPSTQIVKDKGSFCFIKALISFRRALLSRPNVELVEEETQTFKPEQYVRKKT